MKNFLAILFLTVGVLSCSKDEDNAPLVPIEVDFGFNVVANNNSYQVSASDASTGVPLRSSYQWAFDGIDNYYNQNFKALISNVDGLHSITLRILTPDAITYSKTKSFMIKNGLVITEQFRIDTLIKEPIIKEPTVDFTYSIVYRADSLEVYIGFADASNNITDDCSYSWYINGQSITGQKNGSYNIYSNGTYSINHQITIGNKTYSKYKEFNITEMK